MARRQGTDEIGDHMFTHFMFLMLAGCPDPTTAADLGNPGPGGAPPGAPGGGGSPGALSDGPPPEPGQFDLAEGAGVRISGTLSYAGKATGQLRIDILKTPTDAPPMLLHVEKLDTIGNYSIQVPPNTGSVSLVAFVDADDDGPSAHDPAGLISIDISDSNLDDIDIQLSDEPDLGALTPGDSPPPTEIPADDPAPQAKAEIKVQVEAHDDASEPKALPETSATE